MKKLPWSDDEIIRSWKNCADPPTHVSILAQLNNCKEIIIKDILFNANIKSFRDVYCDENGNYLDVVPSGNYRVWTDADDELLLIFRRRNKMKWCEIGVQFDTSPMACKARYFGILRKNRKAEVV